MGSGKPSNDVGILAWDLSEETDHTIKDLELLGNWTAASKVFETQNGMHRGVSDTADRQLASRR